MNEKITIKNQIQNNFVAIINQEKKSLLNEIKAIEYTTIFDKLDIEEYKNKKVACISKIQVLNKILMLPELKNKLS